MSESILYVFQQNEFQSSPSNPFLQDVRSKALKKLNDLKKELSILETELNAYGDSNPARVEEVKRAAFLAKEATYRWTGTTFLSCVKHKIHVFEWRR